MCLIHQKKGLPELNGAFTCRQICLFGIHLAILFFYTIPSHICVYFGDSFWRLRGVTEGQHYSVINTLQRLVHVVIAAALISGLYSQFSDTVVDVIWNALLPLNVTAHINPYVHSIWDILCDIPQFMLLSPLSPIGFLLRVSDSKHFSVWVACEEFKLAIIALPVLPSFTVMYSISVDVCAVTCIFKDLLMIWWCD